MAEQVSSEQSIFLKALEKTSENERAAYLDGACGSDHKLRAEVESLLSAHDRLPGSHPRSQPPTAEEQPAGDGPGSVIGPYKLLEQIGEGGFGLVFMADQRYPLRRKVAFKIIKPGMDTRMVVARFEAERQALALMDHPNIAGVFDGGETSGGRPFFVMELVRGLAITDYCDQNQLTPRERLELFLDVCKAVQHAHHKGIIHRDIKPTNILVAVHDTRPVVKVIDFGIAKAIGQQLTEKTLFTNFAQMVGTPLYMSPEQAGLSGLDVDTRSDIYSLGVLLYELLTGRTPFDKKRIREADYDEIRRIIREEEPPRPSTRVSTMGQAASTVAAQRKSDPKRLSQLCKGELDWIVMKALEKDRTRRYETASAFAADVERYLHDEPVQACPPSAAYRLRKFARRNKGKLAAVAGLLLAITAFAGGVGWTLQERAGRAARTASGVELALDEVAQKQKDKQWHDAFAALSRADGLAAGGTMSSDLLERLRLVRAAVEQGQEKQRKDQQMAAELAGIRLKKTEVKDSSFEWARANDEYEQAFRAYGIDVEQLDPAEAAARIRASAIAPELVIAMDDWINGCVNCILKEKRRGRLLSVARLADEDLLRTEVREAVDKDDPRALVKLATAPSSAWMPPSTVLLLAGALVTINEAQEAVSLLLKAQARHPEDFWINHELGSRLSSLEPAQHEKAVIYYTAALALRKSPGVYLNLGVSLRKTGALDEAMAAYREAIRLKPDYAEPYTALGNVLAQKGQLDDALAAHQQSLRLKPDYALAHANLGTVLEKQSRMKEAIAAYKEAVRNKPDMHEAHNKLGLMLKKVGNLTEAIAAYQEAIRHKSDFKEAHLNLGAALGESGDMNGAIAALEEAIRLDPNYGIAHFNLGSALSKKGDLKAAISAYKEAVRCQPENALAHLNLGIVLYKSNEVDAAIAAFKATIRLQPNQAVAHRWLGLASEKKGQLDDAINAYRAFVKLKQDDVVIYANLGKALRSKGQIDEAIAVFEEGIRLNPGYTDFKSELGICLAAAGQLDAAITAFKDVILLQPNAAPAYYNLGVASDKKGAVDEAIGFYREAISLKWNTFDVHFNLAGALDKKGAMDEAIASYQEAIRLKPGFAVAHQRLGLAFGKTGRMDEAIAAYQESIRLQANAPLPYYYLGNALGQLGRLDPAIEAYREAVRLQPNFAEAHCRLGMLLQGKGKFAEALLALQRGHELGIKSPKWSLPSEAWLKECLRLTDVDVKLAAVMKGELQPTAGAGWIELAWHCLRYKRMSHTALGLYEKAFAAQPELEQKPNLVHRYNAACAAALAGCGNGEDVGRLDDKMRAEFRKQALTWLRTDLDDWRQQFDKEPGKNQAAILKKMQLWQKDADFHGVRGEALAGLPEAERQAWQQLWDDVETLRARTAKKE